MIHIPEGSGALRPARPLALASGILLAAALIWVVALGAPSTQAARGHHQRLHVPQGFLGVLFAPNVFDDRDAGKVADTGIRTMRIGLTWSRVQPQRDGPFNWDATDTMIARLAANEITALPTLSGTPAWIAPQGTTAPVVNQAAKDAWQKFVTAAVRRYRPGGTFWTPAGGTSPFHERCGCGARPVPIPAWQIWNEPNLKHYFTPKPSPKQYATLVKLSRSAIDRADPRAKLVLAGLSGAKGKPGDIDVPSYLRGLYRVRGVKQSFDVAAFHPYAHSIGQMRTKLSQFRKVMQQKRDRRTPLWLTEVGWGSRPPDQFGVNKGLQGQKRMLQRSTKLLLHKRKAWRLQREYWFFWRDPPKSDRRLACSFCDSSGLLKNDRRPKPAYRVFARFAHLQAG